MSSEAADGHFIHVISTSTVRDMTYLIIIGFYLYILMFHAVIHYKVWIFSLFLIDWLIFNKKSKDISRNLDLHSQQGKQKKQKKILFNLTTNGIFFYSDVLVVNMLTQSDLIFFLFFSRQNKRTILSLWKRSINFGKNIQYTPVIGLLFLHCVRSL